MRSVNLIPPEEQRGDRAPMRTGVFTYVLIGGLAVLLLLIAAVALTGKQISDRKSQKADLEKQLAQETTRAGNLAAFTNFANVEQNRANTLAGLAQSRFDWSRVLHELSVVLPKDVTINTLTGTVSPDVQLDTQGQVDLRADVSGPALEILGCAPSQPTVAAFVASLEDIDGVTRVGLESSQLPDSQSSGASTGGASASANDDNSECTIAPLNYKYALVVAFDAVPTPGTATAAPAAPPSTAPPSTGGTQSGQDSQTTDNSQAQQSAEVASVKDKAHNATSKLLPGG